MKANEFVKKFGLDLAKRDIAALDSGFIKRKDFFEHYGFDILDDLKRLVESHELVESEGGLTNLKRAFQIERDCGGVQMTPIGERLFQAIADVESCQ